MNVVAEKTERLLRVERAAPVERPEPDLKSIIRERLIPSRDEIRVALRWAAVLVAPVIVCTVVAFLATMAMERVYAARTELVFQLSQTATEIPEQYRATQTVVATGRTVLEPVSEVLDMPASELEENLSVDFPKNGAVMRLQYADPSPTQAVAILEAILDQYLIVLKEMERIDGANHKLLAAPFLLENPVRPKPLQAAAIGAIVGLAIALAAFALVQRVRGTMVSVDLGTTSGIGVAEGAEVSAESGALAADARTVAIWTLVSRMTGFGRVVALAAVLGPTFFGNLFQTVLLIPYVVCELLARSMMPALLAPPMVHALDRGDPATARRLARGFLGVALPVFSVIALIGALFAPALLWLVTIAVHDPEVRAQQIALGQPLLIALMPQVVLYGIVGIGMAVQHAHRRFAFATAGQSIENIAMMAVMGGSALVFGIGLDVHHVSMTEVITLGIGSTAAVGIHAAAQWFGAYRLGVPLIPTAGWLNPRVRQIFRMLVPSSASAGLSSIGWLAMTVASGQVPGGAIAFQIAQAFYNLPNSLCALPIAFAQLPRLSRDFGRKAFVQFHATYRASVRLALFVAIPGGLLFLGVPHVLAGAVSFGKMSDPAAIGLIAAVMSGLGLGMVGEAVFVVSTSATFARLDAASTLYAAALRLLITLAGIPLALRAGSPAASLAYLGLAYSVAVLAAATFLRLKLASVLPKIADSSAKWLVANVIIAGVSIAPAVLIAWRIDHALLGFADRILGAFAIILISGALYLLLQFLRRSPELKSLFSFTGVGLRAGGPPEADGIVR